MMPLVIRTFVIAVGFLLFIAGFFVVYSYFLLDYSLESLEFALITSHDESRSNRVGSFNLNQAMVQDMALEEIAREEMDLKNLVFMELASRSLKQGMEAANFSRAKFYIQEVAQKQETKRSGSLNHLDSLHRGMRQMIQFVMSRFREVQGQYLHPSAASSSEDVSSFLVLGQAEDKIKNWQLDEAADLYRKYLKLYPRRPDRAYVTISLCHLLIKQKKLPEAERLLRDIQIAFIGNEEGVIASRMLKRIDAIKNRESKIIQLLDQIPHFKNTETGEGLELKLGREYLFAYELGKAEEIFKRLSHAKQDTLRHKAKFLLGWVYKIQAAPEESEKIFEDLILEDNLEEDLSLGLQAQLADIYYEKKDFKKALAYYEKLSEQAQQAVQAGKIVQQAWLALAEVEQAGIYYSEFGDIEKANAHLARAGGTFSGNPYFENLKQAVNQKSREDLRALAFDALKKMQLRIARDLFEKNLRIQPDDAWSYSGLATAQVLLSDIREAVQSAEKGYRLKVDDYTASVLGWLSELLSRHDKAIQYYREALNKNANNRTVRYNLAHAYLMINEYEESMTTLSALAPEMKDSKKILGAKVLNNLGCSAWGLGKHQEGMDFFREALAGRSDFPDARMNLETIKTLQPVHE